MAGGQSISGAERIPGLDDRFWEMLCEGELGFDWPDIDPCVARTLTRVRRLLEYGVEHAASVVQSCAGIYLVDLTMPEAWEEALEIAIRQLLEMRGNLAKAPNKDLFLQKALHDLRTFLRGAYKAYRTWLPGHRASLRSKMPEPHLKTVTSIWEVEDPPPTQPTEYGRQQATVLKMRLDDDDDYVPTFRGELRIPRDGFQTSDQAARWLYDRRPQLPVSWRSPRSGRPASYSWLLRSVGALATAADELIRVHNIGSEWRTRPALYLLRGILDPLPRKRHRERPRAELHARLVALADKYGNSVAATVHNCGLTDQEADSLIEAVRAHASVWQVCHVLPQVADLRDSWVQEDEADYLIKGVREALREQGSKMRIHAVLARVADLRDSWVQEDEMVSDTYVARIKYRAKHAR